MKFNFFRFNIENRIDAIQVYHTELENHIIEIQKKEKEKFK